jgi:uncharacterized protein
MRMSPRFLPAVCWLLVAVCCGCSSHVDRLRQVRQAFYTGDLVRAEELIDKGLSRGKKDADVLRLEQAMVLLAGGKPGEAERILRDVRDSFDHLDSTSGVELVASMLTDDQQLSYAGEDYEKVMVRAMLAISSLLQDGYDAEAYSLQVADKQQQIIEAAIQGDGSNPKAHYQQVALGPYIRAMLREESHRDFDDVARNRAMVVNWQPDFQAGKADLLRAQQGKHSERGWGAVYVFALVGRGPYKEEVAEIPTTAAMLVADRIVSHNASQTLPPTLAPITIPKVVAAVNVVKAVEVRVPGIAAGRTETITDITKMAVAQQEALLPEIVGRAVARRAVKKAVIYSSKEALGVQKGSLESLPFDIAGVVWEATERADTRCWGLLPDTIQVVRLELPAGEHPLTVAPLAGNGRPCGPAVTASIRVDDGRNSYVLATFPGPRLVGRIVTNRE